MFIAREKLKTNVVEYILYMYHIEDVIRANNFEVEKLESNVISKYSLPEKETNEVRTWYSDLIAQMDRDDVKEVGHIKAIQELILNLNDLHIQLINTLSESIYLEQYQIASPIIKELKNKMMHAELTEMEVCFNGLYGFMLLKMKGNAITQETTDAISVFSQLLRLLSKKYHN